MYIPSISARHKVLKKKKSNTFPYFNDEKYRYNSDFAFAVFFLSNTSKTKFRGPFLSSNSPTLTKSRNYILTHAESRKKVLQFRSKEPASIDFRSIAKFMLVPTFARLWLNEADSLSQ